MTSTDHRQRDGPLPGSARQGGGPLRRAVRHRCQYSGRRAFRIRGAAFADLRVFRRAFDPNRHVGQGVRSARGYFQFQLSEGGLVGRRSCALFQPFGDSLPSRSRSRRSGRVRIPTISISGCMPTAATCSRKITALPQGILERCESLEQLRWLENGYRIRTAVTMTESLAIDTPQDLQAAVDYMLGRTK